MVKNIYPGEISVGVVGLGLMGTSIVVSLLIAGHKVIAIAPLPVDLAPAPDRIREQLQHCKSAGLLTQPLEYYLTQVIITEDFSQLHDCELVLECVIELPEVKKSVYAKIEAVVSPEAIIASNTSAIPISEFQGYVAKPDRFLGIHWAEPAYMTRFMEITCGLQTAPRFADWVYELAHHWGKEPTLLKKDIRGFVTNRLMYAVYREAFAIVENGEASLEDVDKAFRYDAGSWMTFMGLFRRMDYQGLQDYPEIFKNIFPQLSNSQTVPPLMQKMIDIKTRGTQHAKGLYDYTPEEARQWEEAFAVFNQEIFDLAAQYPSETAKR